jgi:RNA polymerase sigma-70 factor, ECF subfamily
MTPKLDDDLRSDEELIAALGQGDSAALGHLYDRYNRLAMSVAYRVLENRSAAEDCLQDAFLLVWRNHASFNPERGSVKSWLLTIVRNAAIDRRRGKEGRARGEVPIDELELFLASREDDPFEQAATSLQASQIQAALQRLPAEQREAIELAYFGGLTHHEIAERSGTPLGTVKGRMRLGLHKLRQLLLDAQLESSVDRPNP